MKIIQFKNMTSIGGWHYCLVLLPQHQEKKRNDPFKNPCGFVNSHIHKLPVCPCVHTAVLKLLSSRNVSLNTSRHVTVVEEFTARGDVFPAAAAQHTQSIITFRRQIEPRCHHLNYGTDYTTRTHAHSRT